MKVIDLFQRIANGEEVPNKITIRGDTLVYNKGYSLYLQDYYYMEDEENATWKIWAYDLNDEVEIIEEEPRNIEVCGSYFTQSEYNELWGKKEDKPIGRCNLWIDDVFPKLSKSQRQQLQVEVVDKINEIIDKINEMEDK